MKRYRFLITYTNDMRRVGTALVWATDEANAIMEFFKNADRKGFHIDRIEQGTGETEDENEPT